MLNLNDIRIDGGTQSRVELNQETVAEYAEAYRAGASFPPVIVFYDGADRWLADGFHRYFGAKAAGLEQIYEEVIPGTQRDAVLYSLKANATHGLKRSNADKRKSVETVLRDAEWVTWSDRKIAEVCGVGAPLVGDVRRAICNPITDAPATRTVERNGKTYEQNTSNIGKRAPAQAPSAAPSRPNPAAPSAAAAPPAPLPDDEVGFDPFEELEAMNNEIARLRKILEADNKAAEVMKWQGLCNVAQRRSDEHLATINSRDRQIKFLARQLERCGKAVGELDQDKIAPAVEAVARAAKAVA